jgi:putative ABC transport system permease protein
MRELLTQTWSNLMAHKLRSFLTMFGIVWGVISIVLLSALSAGFQQGNMRVLKELGKNILHRPGQQPAVHALRDDAEGLPDGRQ